MFGPNFHFYTLFESSKDSQVCRYYSYRILTSFVFKNYWNSKEDEWNEEVANPSKKGEIIEVEASMSSSKACYDKSSMKRRAWTSWWTVQYGPSPMIASKAFIQIEVSIENLIYAILVGNQNLFMCKWLLVYIAYFILYREYGQLGELFNMDPLPWFLSIFLYKLNSLNKEPHICHPCGKSKYIHVQMIIGLHCILHLV